MNDQISTAAAPSLRPGETSTEPDSKRATATITFTGLSLLWFSPDSLGTNLGYFSRGHSPVNIEILDKDSKVLYSSAEKGGPFASTVKHINLNADPNRYGAKCFARDSNDERNFAMTPALSGR